jgi:hypothetical protein
MSYSTVEFTAHAACQPIGLLPRLIMAAHDKDRYHGSSVMADGDKGDILWRKRGSARGPYLAVLNWSRFWLNIWLNISCTHVYRMAARTPLALQPNIGNEIIHI